MERVRPIWFENDKVKMVDQRLLPVEYKIVEVETVEEMTEYIKTLAVRGAPAIGNAAGFGIYLGVKNSDYSNKEEFLAIFNKAYDLITGSRPTAVNLFWASNRMKETAENIEDFTPENVNEILLNEAKSILAEDIASCKSIGLYGADILKDAETLLTHCNAGSMATSEYGTALAPMYIKQERGEKLKVYADETRPLLQGARITAWELAENDIDVTVITDSMAGVVIKEGIIDAIIVGADRIASNGDSANKIGTYTLSVLAKEHNIPFYIAAPFSTVDFELEEGKYIPIEERKPEEITHFGNLQTVPEGASVFNPAFDVTPHENITGIITDKGVAYAPYKDNLEYILNNGVLKE